jgi:hypothetical protein
MLHDQNADFATRVWTIVRRTGRSAPLIANEIIGEYFPETLSAAEKEGADKMLRMGVIAAIKKIIRDKDQGADAQTDFMRIDQSFLPFVEQLGKEAYYVEALEAYASVGELIDQPDMLDDARKFMRRKGDECHAEADKLDALYEAVMAAA